MSSLCHLTETDAGGGNNDRPQSQEKKRHFALGSRNYLLVVELTKVSAPHHAETDPHMIVVAWHVAAHMLTILAPPLPRKEEIWIQHFVPVTAKPILSLHCTEPHLSLKYEKFSSHDVETTTSFIGLSESKPSRFRQETACNSY